MTTPLDRFVNLLLRSDMISEEQLASLRRQLATEDEEQAEGELARKLADSGHLTRFQAEEVRQGKSEDLVLGEYLILEPVGRGGMGQIYRARHSVMKREVAIKFTLPGEDGKLDAGLVERFQREVEAASKLTHPNIVTSLDAGRRGDVLYLVMEYVRGNTLANQVRNRGPMSFRQCLDCAIQVAQGLEYSHSKGIVHRDIKPSNLLLTSDGQVKILDMGLARMHAVGEDGNQLESTDGITRNGQLLGTVDFMAPEQALDPRNVDGRADIYGLGCTIYYLLTGAVPYRLDGTTAMGRLIAHRESPIPVITAARADVPAGFQAVFEKMLAKQPQQRYSSVSSLLLDLRRIQAEPVESLSLADTVSMGAETTNGRASRLWLIPLAGMVCAVLVYFTAQVIWFGAEETPAGVATAPGATKEQMPEEILGPVDLLQRIDLARDVVSGTGWQLTEGKLVIPASTPAKLCVPVPFPPSFDVELVVTRTAEREGPLVLGINDKSRKFYLLIDAVRKNGEVRVTGLGTRSGRLVVVKEGGLQLRLNSPTRIQLAVQSNSVSLLAENQTVLQWDGQLSDLELGGGWSVGATNGVLIGANEEAQFAVSSLKVTPSPRGKSSDGK